jgi:hypothetical protein
MTAFGLFFAFHFILCLFQSHGAAPAIKDGEYVLDNHGYIIQTISQAEFLKLKAAELRLVGYSSISCRWPIGYTRDA